MDCSCDYEQPEFFVREKHKARLQHCCSECRRTISPGEEYERVRGKWDGDVLTFKMCCRCMSLRDHITAHVPCFCWPFSGLLEEARETVKYLPPEATGSGLLFELGRIAVAIRRTQKFVKAAQP